MCSVGALILELMHPRRAVVKGRVHPLCLRALLGALP